MRSTFDSTLTCRVAGAIPGLVVVSFLALANKRFGVLGGATDLGHGSAEDRGFRSWRSLLGVVLGGAIYARPAEEAGDVL